VAEKKNPTALDLIADHKVAFVVNVSDGEISAEKKSNSKSPVWRTDGYLIRRAAVDANMPLFTDISLAKAFVRARVMYRLEDVAIKSWQEYLEIGKIKDTKK
jgi:carbamoyl-phosphate synthase large subunit